MYIISQRTVMPSQERPKGFRGGALGNATQMVAQERSGALELLQMPTTHLGIEVPLPTLANFTYERAQLRAPELVFNRPALGPFRQIVRARDFMRSREISMMWKPGKD